MSIADKLTTIAENEQKVYDAGYSQSESEFWDNVQRFGERTNYERAFRFWDGEYIRPKYKITAAGAVTYLFCDCRHLKTVDPNDYDFSNMKPTFANSGDAYAMFCRCYELEYVPDLGIPACTVDWMFAFCSKLHTIEVLRVAKKCKYDSAFAELQALQNITFEGEIGNSLSFSVAKRLTHKSIMSIIDHLYDYVAEGSTTTYTLTLGTTNLAKLSEEEQAIAIQKGWTLA